MKAELIHIECGIFNGIANYKIGDKLLRFELGTPNFNDYGEYRVYTEFEVLDFNEKYRGHVWPNQEIELSDEQAAWWLVNRNPVEKYMSNGQVEGGKTKDGKFLIRNKENEFIEFTEWEKLEHDPYELFMFNVLKTFFNWMQSDDYNPVSGDMLIYPKF
jgi:hypothetical protein